MATATCSYTVTEPSSTLSASCAGTNVSCNGGSDGSASVAVTGGTSPYNYLWSTGDTDPSISNLIAGSYTVTVTDDASATATCSYDVTEPSALNISCSGTNVSIQGGSDGSASVAASDGTSPYSYAWSDGESTSTESKSSGESKSSENGSKTSGTNETKQSHK